MDNSKEIDKIDKGVLKGEDIPSGVVDMDAYKKVLVLEKSTIFREDIRILQTSDEDLSVDMLMIHSALKKAIDHLPEDEKERIIKRARGTKVLKGKLDSLKAKAYGLHNVKSHPSITGIILKERSSELIEYFGRFFTVNEVHKIVNEQWGMRIGRKSLEVFQKKNFTAIKKAQEDYSRDHRDIRLSHKKARLEELTVMYQSRKDRYDQTGSREDYKLMLTTLKLIGDMVEGQQVRVAGEITHKIETTINYGVQQEIMKGLTINDIIIARVAARNGINPQFLSARLHQSIYAKHSGFAPPNGDIGEQEISYPSSMVYNWDEVKRLHEKKDAQDAKDIQYVDVSEEDKLGFDEAKTKLLERVRLKREFISEARKRIEDNKK